MIGDYLDRYTFSYLINQALNTIPDTLDKREGSIIYDALAPCCYELAETFAKFKALLLNTYASTANAEYLDLRVAEMGLTRYPATHAVRRGDFERSEGIPASIPLGSRFSTIVESGSLNFYVDSPYIDLESEMVVPGAYNLICEEAGISGNDYIGPILPISNLSNLYSATMSTLITPARNLETDEELRIRYFDAINKKAFGGNVAQYDEEIKAIAGVGEVQIFPVWNGGGTVKCSIIDAEYNAISDEFIAQIQEAIDPPPQGTGLGMAPIGHRVTITTPTEFIVNISTKISIDNRYTLPQLENSIKDAIENYLFDLRRLWGIGNELNQYSLAIYIARINAAILTVAGVSNVSETTINGFAEDLILTENASLQELPVLGSVNIYE